MDLGKKITFDSFIRSVTLILVVVAIGLLVNRLSAVLLPFFIAWLLAYMLYPLVRFLQYRCRLRNRIVSIAVAAAWVSASGWSVRWRRNCSSAGSRSSPARN